MNTDPALPDPALPDPALPDPALPDPALPDSPRSQQAPAAPPPRRKKPRQAKPKYRYPAHLRNSTPKWSRCHLCGLQTLTCTYDTLPLRLDPHPLSTSGEVRALWNGQRTWLLSSGNIWRRHVWAIQTSLTGIGGTIHREHRCDRQHPPPGDWKAAPEPSDAPDF